MQDFHTLYLDFEKERLRSESSSKHYRIILRSLEEFANKDFLSLTKADAIEYLKQYECKTSSNTRYTSTGNIRLSVLKSIGTYMETRLPGYVSPFSFIASDHIQKYSSADILSLDAVSDILAALEANGSFREFLAISLTLRMCLKTTELVSIRRKDFVYNSTGNLFLIVPDSDAGSRLLPVPEDIASLIQKLLPDFFSSPEDTPLFQKSRGQGAMSSHALRCSIRRAAGSNIAINLRDVRTLGILLLLQDNKESAQVSRFAGNTDRWLFRFDDILNEQVASVSFPNIRVHLSDDEIV